MTTDVNLYFEIGCGRCSRGGTPDCKIHLWDKILAELRRIVLECDLVEDCKWGSPCYTYNGANILMIGALNDYASIGFFKGSLLEDSHNMLYKQSANMQAIRQLKFTQVKDVLTHEQYIMEYIFQAIEVEKLGLKVPFKSVAEYDMPQELAEMMDQDPSFKSAFESLTPGRQKGYLLHFSGAKQSQTRIDRILKAMPNIFLGKGMHDDYKANKR
jgi:uncharacterized protein YdeI (YjbR/CyaY-like superfamily)